MPANGVPAEPTWESDGTKLYFLSVGQYCGPIKSYPAKPRSAARRHVASKLTPPANANRKPGTNSIPSDGEIVPPNTKGVTLCLGLFLNFAFGRNSASPTEPSIRFRCAIPALPVRATAATVNTRPHELKRRRYSALARNASIGSARGSTSISTTQSSTPAFSALESTSSRLISPSPRGREDMDVPGCSGRLPSLKCTEKNRPGCPARYLAESMPLSQAVERSS